MPYFIIELRDRVIADGQKGVVIALGSAHNKSASFFVRLDNENRDIWFSRDEVVPESYQGGKNVGQQPESGVTGSKGRSGRGRPLEIDLVVSKLRKWGEICRMAIFKSK